MCEKDDAAAIVRSWERSRPVRLKSKVIDCNLALPDDDHILRELQTDSETRVTLLKDGDAPQDGRNWFRTASIDQLKSSCARIVHYDLQRFYGASSFLAGFQEKIMIPWRMWLTCQGFVWQSCHPVLFISLGCAHSTYHSDSAQGLVWQARGTKLFYFPRAVEDVAPIKRNYGRIQDSETAPKIVKRHFSSDLLVPGNLLWNPFLTPHWTEATTDISLTFTLFHVGLSKDGRIAKREERLREFWDCYPEMVWRTEFKKVRY